LRLIYEGQKQQTVLLQLLLERFEQAAILPPLSTN